MNVKIINNIIKLLLVLSIFGIAFQTLARTPYDDMVEAYALRDYTAPNASEYKANINDKNYSYYGYKRLLKNATAFINWMNAPVLAKEGMKLEDHTVRSGAEFRGYVLAHMERNNIDWRKKCDRATELENPNLLAYQIAQLLVNAEPPKDARLDDNSITAIAFSQAVLMRCLQDLPLKLGK